MPDERTIVTELGTALGTLPYVDAESALDQRPPQVHIGDQAWDQLGGIARSRRYAAELATAFANGRALLHSPDGLRGRTPLTIEWTGGRRPPGDEVAPIDLRIDHVYLISCKYESDILANASPGRLFDGLLSTSRNWERGDWYEAVAPAETAALYRACVSASGFEGLPPAPAQCTRDQLARSARLSAGARIPTPPRRRRTANCAEWSATLRHGDGPDSWRPRACRTRPCCGDC